MYCPKCGASQSDELNYCKLCGANLASVRRAVETQESATRPDWDKTWMADMMLSEDERRRRRRERHESASPEAKRQNEIKGGIITSSVGVGLMIFLYVIMQGIIRGTDLPRVAEEILSRVWIAGILPFFVGIGLLINAMFFGGKALKPAGEEGAAKRGVAGAEPQALPAADTREFITPEFSVTEGTTRHMKSPVREQ